MVIKAYLVKKVLVAVPPTPPGVLLTVFGDNERYVNSNYKTIPGVYLTGYYVIKDKKDYYFVLGRANEVIKVAGHRLGTREIEEVICAHPAVAEACPIGIEDSEGVKGQVPVAKVVLKQSQKPTSELKTQIELKVRADVDPIASLNDLKFVQNLPKARSGKIIRRVIKNMFEHKDIGDISTIEDGASIDQVREAIAGLKEHKLVY